MPGPRVYCVDDVNEMIPQIEEIFVELDRLKQRLKNHKIRVNAIELIWGEAINDDTCADHQEYLHLLEELRSTTERFNTEAERIADLGGVVKSVDPGLVDFYAVHSGVLVFLCWQRGEREISHWHHVDKGFGERLPLDDLGDV